MSVLRLRRTDQKDAIVVVLIYSKGHNPLDLELVASEGENAWGATGTFPCIGPCFEVLTDCHESGDRETWNVIVGRTDR